MDEDPNTHAKFPRRLGAYSEKEDNDPFVIRYSQSRPDCFAISHPVDGKVVHQLIEHEENGLILLFTLSVRLFCITTISF